MMLEVRDLDASYGRAQILAGVALDVAPGEVVALLGRNGAGKSTTLKTILGLVPATRGRIVFDGADIAGVAPYRIARLGLGYVPEERRIFTDLTVHENLEVARRPPRDGIEPWTPARLFKLFPNLETLIDRLGGRMSGGEQQMLAVARTLMGNPKMLLLDEPSEGLAPLIVEQMEAAIAALKRDGLAVLLCEQNLHFARRLADRAVILEKGQVRYTATMAALMADAAARKTYLEL
jgi:branched-chain amino acid transport system ATP-binding protein